MRLSYGASQQAKHSSHSETGEKSGKQING